MQIINSRIFYYKLCKNPSQYYKSHENSYQCYKSHENSYQCYKSCVPCDGSYDKIIITTRLLPLALLFVLRARNNTDGNKLVIFSGIAFYYGDTYITLLTDNLSSV